MDRGTEVGTLRRRLEELAGQGRSAELLRAMARRHLAAQEGALGFFYIDGHMRAYHDKARLPKAHLARARLAAPAEASTWICDQEGQGVLVWSAEPGVSLSGELRTAVKRVRALVGPGGPPNGSAQPGRLVPQALRRAR